MTTATAVCACGALTAAECMYQTGSVIEPEPGCGFAVAQPVRRTQLRALADVAPRRVEWLLRGLIPLRALTLVAGVGGLGKSTWLAAVAAQASRGDLLGGNPADVILVSYEDTAAEILRPRVEAAQGDLTRVHELFVEPQHGAPLSLPNDFEELAQHVQSTDAKLVVLDPVVASLSVEYDAHKDQHVRIVLAELAALAEDAGCAVAIVGHLNKNASRDAYLRVGSSVAFYNAARSVVLVTADPEEPEAHRLITQAKANWARLRPVQRHVLEEIQLERRDPESGQPIVTGRMRYLEDADEVDRNDVLAEHRGDGGDRGGGEQIAYAVVWLGDALRDGGWHDSAGLKMLAGANRISERTLKRAAQELEVEHERRGFPSSTWWRDSSQAHPVPTNDGPTVGGDANPHHCTESEHTDTQSGQPGHGDKTADPTGDRERSTA